MHVTPFGWLFLPIVIGILLRRRDWLPGLLIVAACLHAPAVFVIGGGDGSRAWGITPWLAVSFAIFLHLCALVRRDGLQPLRCADRTTQRLLAGWMLFAALGIASAFTLPILFEGIPTYDSLDELNISIGTKALEWRIGNAAQALNLAVVAMLFLYGLFARPFANSTRMLLRSLVIATVVALGFSLLHRTMLWSGTSEHWLVTNSLNPGYRHSIGYLFARDGVRVGWPFSEPSYASAWFAALFVAGLALWLRGRPATRGRVALPLLILTGIGVLNSFSGTGVAALVVCSGLLLIAELANALRLGLAGKPMQLVQMARMVAACAAIMVALYAASSQLEVYHPHWGSRTLPAAAVEFLRVKVNDAERTDMSRTRSNKHAVDIVVDTHGLGVGLGSNRASSYVFNLASTVGVAPCLLLAMLIVAQLRGLRRGDRDNDAALVVHAGTLAMLVAISLGISDPIWPAWWIWLLLSFWLAIQGTERPSVPPTTSIRPARSASSIA